LEARHRARTELASPWGGALDGAAVLLVFWKKFFDPDLKIGFVWQKSIFFFLAGSGRAFKRTSLLQAIFSRRGHELHKGRICL
jgi:hypothetical protein